MTQNASPETTTPKPNSPGSNGDIATRKVLNSWKEISAYMARGLRTVQRYEHQLGLPIHRVSTSNHSPVLAFSDEIDKWLDDTSVKEQQYVRPTLIVIDPAVPNNLSSRKLVLEIGRFNVLTAYTIEEAYATAHKYHVDGFVVDHVPGMDNSDELCEAFKELYPKAVMIAVTSPSHAGGEPRCVDYVVDSANPDDLLKVVLSIFGVPRME